MPLQAGTSQETISENIQETLESSTFGWGKSKRKRLEMAQAAAHRKARESGGRKRRSRRGNPHGLSKAALRGCK